MIIVSVAAAVVALIGMVALVVHAGADRSPVGPNPTPFWPGDGTASLLAESAARLAETPANTERAIPLADRAVLDSPLNPVAIALLADAKAKAGDKAGATALYELALDRSKRIPGLHLWAISDALDRKDYEALLAHIDGYLRIVADVNSPNPEPDATTDSILQNLVTLAVNPVILPELRNVISLNPPWRDLFLSKLATTGDFGSFEKVVNNIVDYRDIKPEWRTYLYRMIDAGQAKEARQLWHGLVDPNAPATAEDALLFDGGFERAGSDDIPFSWIIFPAPSTRISFDPSIYHGGKQSLSINFLTTDPFRNVFQNLALQPGDYQFSGFIRMNDIKSPRGLQWLLFCGRQKFQVVGSSDLFSGSSDWQEFGFTFTIPDTGCDDQVLQLLVPARVSAEQPIAGTVWFDDLSITRSRP